MSNKKISFRCVGCKAYRDITEHQAAKGRPFCPKCGNLEIEVKAKQNNPIPG